MGIEYALGVLPWMPVVASILDRASNRAPPALRVRAGGRSRARAANLNLENT
jgi:hypothetical protein